MDDLTTTTVLLVETGSSREGLSKEDIESLWSFHRIFMLYLFPAFILLLVTLAEGWSWGFTAGVVLYSTIMHFLLPRERTPEKCLAGL